MSTDVLKSYIDEHEHNPIYLAAKISASKNKDKHIDAQLQSRILSYVFADMPYGNERIDLQHKIIVELGLPRGFHRSYQDNIAAIPNKKLNKFIFDGYFNHLENNQMNKPYFDVFKLFGMDSNVYQSVQKNVVYAYDYQAFAMKIKSAISDLSSFPVQMQRQEYAGIRERIVKRINLSLFSKIGVMFRYPHTNARNIILKPFVSDVEYLFDQNTDYDKEYKQGLKEVVYRFHPNMFGRDNLVMPRQHTIAYLEHKLNTLDEESFAHFAAAFESEFVDADIVANIVGERSSGKNNSELFDKNYLTLLKTNPEHGRKVDMLKKMGLMKKWLCFLC